MEMKRLWFCGVCEATATRGVEEGPPEEWLGKDRILVCSEGCWKMAYPWSPIPPRVRRIEDDD